MSAKIIIGSFIHDTIIFFALNTKYLKVLAQILVKQLFYRAGDSQSSVMFTKPTKKSFFQKNPKI